MRRCQLALLILASLLALAAIAGPAPGAPPVAAQDDLAGWHTIAGGDEILALAADPWEPEQLWVGTEGGGLLVWDLAAGELMEQYLFPDAAGLLSNTIYDIAFRDSDSSVWLATAAGVARLDAGGQFVTYDRRDGLPELVITDIAVARDGTVWAGTFGAGVAALAPGERSWTVYAVNDAQPELGPGNNKVADIAIAVDGSDQVYVAHGRSSAGEQPALSVYDPGTRTWGTIEGVGPTGDPSQGPAGDQIMAIAIDEGSGDMWLAAWAEGVLRYDGTQWHQYGPTDGLCGKSAWAIAAVEDEVWAACGDDRGGNGVARWNGQGWGTWSTPDLPTDTVVALEVVDGVAYLGTNAPGELGYGIVPVDVTPEPALLTAGQLPWSNDITALLFEEGGVLWAGTRGAGLMRYDGVEWTLYTQDNTQGMLAGNTITDLALRQGQLWVATTKTIPQAAADWADGGVSILDLATGEWQPPLPQAVGGVCNGLPDREVSSLAVGPDPHQRVWIGIGLATGGVGSGTATSYSGEGVVVYDPVEDSWDCYTFEGTGSGEGLMGNTVLDLAVDEGIWLATAYHNGTDGRRHGGGVSHLVDDSWSAWGDEDDGLVTYSNLGRGTNRDPITGDVRTVAVDSRGVVWAGTYDLEQGELSVLWPHVDAVINHLEESGWQADVFPGSGWVSAIAEDSLGRVWIGTTRGHIQEYSPAGGALQDTARGGAYVRNGTSWVALLPPESGAEDVAPSGIAAKAITALAVDPTTGYMWVGTENGGLSVFQSGQPRPTNTPCLTCPTATPTRGRTATSPAVATLDITSTAVVARPTSTPSPPGTPEPEPPPEVPEAGTIILVGAGLAALAWASRRRRTSTSRP